MHTIILTLSAHTQHILRIYVTRYPHTLTHKYKHALMYTKQTHTYKRTYTHEHIHTKPYIYTSAYLITKRKILAGINLTLLQR